MRAPDGISFTKGRICRINFIGARMKLKIFACPNKHAKAFRIVVCSFSLICTAALLCVSAYVGIANGAFEELLGSVGLMMY